MVIVPYFRSMWTAIEPASTHFFHRQFARLRPRRQHFLSALQLYLLALEDHDSGVHRESTESLIGMANPRTRERVTFRMRILLDPLTLLGEHHILSAQCVVHYTYPGS